MLFSADEQLVKKRLKTRANSDIIEARGLKYLMRVQDLMARACRACGVETLKIDAAKSEEAICDQIKNFILS